MATGIVSVALHLLHYEVFSLVLLVVAAVAYLTLIALTALRFGRHRTRFVNDLFEPRLNVGFFTFVAGTGVLGVRVFEEGYLEAALVLWGVAVAAWVLLTYGIGTIFVIGVEADLRRTISANWYLIVVATQSMSILATDLSRHFNPHELLFAAFCLWVVGLALYVGVVLAVSARLLLARVRPSEFTPHYWISMGALAISSLAGSRLLAAAPRLDFLVALHGFIAGLTVAVWALAAWWIPLLVALEGWRVLGSEEGRRHDPRRWATVFPLGMFTVASAHLGAVIAVGALVTFARGFLWLAVAAWAVTAAATIRSLPARVVASPSPRGRLFEAPEE